MADSTLSLLNTQTAVPVKAVDLGDGTYALAVAPSQPSALEATFYDSVVYSPTGSNLTKDSVDVTKSGAKGVMIFYNLEVLASGQTVAVSLVATSPDGTEFIIATSDALVAVGQLVISVYPGSTAQGTNVLSVSMPVPKSWKIRETFTVADGSHSITRSASYSEVL